MLSMLTIRASAFAHGTEQAVSPRRQAGQSWQDVLRANLAVPGTVVKSRKPVASVRPFSQEMGGIPAWPGTIAQLNELNAKAFATRSYANPDQGNYLRRAPWLFPTDGCYAKAAHVSAVAQRLGLPAPGKVFVFGDLRFSSDFVNGGVVYWSYHVVAAYHIANEIYVIDPVVSRSSQLTNGAAMPVAEWMKQISPQPQALEVSLCDSASYTPISACLNGNGNGAYLGHIPDLLHDEYRNLLYVGFEPDQILGPGPEENSQVFLQGL